MMNNQKRVDAGRRGKLEGHKFEEQFADYLNIPHDRLEGGTRSKIDIRDTQFGNLSLKNPGQNNTQVFLTSPTVFKSEMTMPGEFIEFIDLFFGTPSLDDYNALLRKHSINSTCLDQEGEIRRKRVLANHISARSVQVSLEWLNDNHKTMFQLLFSKGYDNWGEPVDALGWAWLKNDVESVKIYTMSDLYKTYCGGEWVVAPSQSTLRFEGKHNQFLHLQMKGSGKKTGWGYHCMMFHMWNGLLADTKVSYPKSA